MIIQFDIFSLKNEYENKSKYKDKCDICKRFNYLRGYNNICICKECFEKIRRRNE